MTITTNESAGINKLESIIPDVAQYNQNEQGF